MATRSQIKIGLSVCSVLILAVLITYLTILKSPDSQDSDRVINTTQLPEVSSSSKPVLEEEASSKPLNSTDNLAQGDWRTEIINALNSPDVSVRMKAVRLLWENTTPEAVELLAMFLDDEENVIAEEAIDALGHIANNSDLGDKILGILIDKAIDKTSKIRGPALLTASIIGDQDQLFPVIEGIIEENNTSALDYAVRALGIINGPETVPYLQKILSKNVSRDIQRNIYSILIHTGSEEAMAILEDDTYSEDREKQVNTVWALSRGTSSNTGAEFLSDALKKKALGDESISIIAASRTAPAVFKEAFKSDNLTNTDKRNLLRVISDNTKLAPRDVRDQVAEVIQPLLNSTDVQVQKEAIETIGAIGATTNQAETLAPKLESESPILQGAALYAYAQYTTPNTYKPLINLWNNEDEKIRRTAFFLSSPFVNNSDMEDLEKATQHTDEFIANGSRLKIKQLEVDEKIKSQDTGE